MADWQRRRTHEDASFSPVKGIHQEDWWIGYESREVERKNDEDSGEGSVKALQWKTKWKDKEGFRYSTGISYSTVCMTPPPLMTLRDRRSKIKRFDKPGTAEPVSLRDLSIKTLSIQYRTQALSIQEWCRMHDTRQKIQTKYTDEQQSHGMVLHVVEWYFCWWHVQDAAK